MTDRITDFGERVEILFRAFHGDTGWGSVPWFQRRLKDDHALEIKLTTLYSWTGKGYVPENRRRVIDDVIAEIAEEATELHMATVDKLDRVL